MHEITVRLDQRSYPILIGQALLPQVGDRLRRSDTSPSAAVISDQNVADLYGATVLESIRRAGYRADLIAVPPGEASKSLATAGTLYDRLLDLGLERSSPLLALGGGVVGDLTGFVAATLYRGVPFIQLPTTLEADVDASVGGKTGVNHPRGKNLIGAFYQPRMVLIDTDALATLDPRDLKAGLAESVKHAVIRDADFFAWHEEHVEEVLAGSPAPTAHLIQRNCAIKAAVVATDEREAGLRAILNFGHTIGHTIEAVQRYALRHGEAVALGMIAAAHLAADRGLIDQHLAQRIVALLARCQVPITCPKLDRPAIFDRMARDKKIVGGRLRFVLPTALGRTIICDDVATDEVHHALDRLEA